MVQGSEQVGTGKEAGDRMLIRPVEAGGREMDRQPDWCSRSMGHGRGAAVQLHGDAAGPVEYVWIWTAGSGGWVQVVVVEAGRARGSTDLVMEGMLGESGCD